MFLLFLGFNGIGCVSNWAPQWLTQNGWDLNPRKWRFMTNWVYHILYSNHPFLTEYGNFLGKTFFLLGSSVHIFIQSCFARIWNNVTIKTRGFDLTDKKLDCFSIWLSNLTMDFGIRLGQVLSAEVLYIYISVFRTGGTSMSHGSAIAFGENLQETRW